jgi:hypothetical protein
MAAAVAAAAVAVRTEPYTALPGLLAICQEEENK